MNEPYIHDGNIVADGDLMLVGEVTVTFQIRNVITLYELRRQKLKSQEETDLETFRAVVEDMVKAKGVERVADTIPVTIEVDALNCDGSQIKRVKPTTWMRPGMSWLREAVGNDLILCRCGEIIEGDRELREHREKGHFDTVDI